MAEHQKPNFYLLKPMKETAMKDLKAHTKYLNN